MLGQHLLSLGSACKNNEAIGVVAFRCTFGNCPTVHVIETLAPDNVRMSAAFLLGVKPQAVGGTHFYPTGRHKRGGLRSSLPPNRVLADLIELVERATHPCFC